MSETTTQLAADIEACRKRLLDGRDSAAVLLDLHGLLIHAPADTSPYYSGLELLASLCDQHGQHLFGHGLRLHSLRLQNKMKDESIEPPPVWPLARYSAMLLCHSVGLPLSSDLGTHCFAGYTLAMRSATGAYLVSMSWRASVAIPARDAGPVVETDVFISFFDLGTEATRAIFREFSVGGPIKLSEDIPGTLLLAASVYNNLGLTISVQSEDFENIFTCSERIINGQLPLELCPGIPDGDDPQDWIGAATLQRLRGAMLFAVKLYGRACALLSASGDHSRQSETYFELVETYLEMGYAREAELMYQHLQADVAPAGLDFMLTRRWGRLCDIFGTSSDSRLPESHSATPSVETTPESSDEANPAASGDSHLIDPEIIRGAGYQFDPSTGKVLGGGYPEEVKAEFEAGQVLNEAWDAAFPEEDSPFVVPLGFSVFEADIPEVGNPRKLRRMKLAKLQTLQKEPPFTRLNRYDELPEATTGDDAAGRFARRIGSAIWVMHYRVGGSFSSEFGSSISPGNISVTGGIYDYETVQLPGHGREIEPFQRQDLINAIRVIRDFVERSARADIMPPMLLTFYEAFTRRTEPSAEFSELIQTLDGVDADVLDGPMAAEWADCLRIDAGLGSTVRQEGTLGRTEADNTGDRTQQRLKALIEQALKEDEPAEHLLTIALQHEDPAKAMLHIAESMGATAAQATNRMAADRAELDAKVRELDAARRVGDTGRVIELSKEALTLVSKEDEPVRWAALHSTLATNLIRDGGHDRAQDIDDAIAHLRFALEVRTRETLPVRWADTHVNLGNAYYMRIRGDRSKNLERAMRYLELALEVFTRETHPQKWGEVQNSLGNLYYDKVAGDRASNLETAIDSYKLALDVLPRQEVPVVWANAQSNLANAYFRRIVGDRRKNVMQAIKHGRLALEVRTQEASPSAWAKSSRYLANFYRSKAEWGGDDDLLTAVSLYYQVLGVLTRNADPEAWATVRDDLSIALKAIPFVKVARVLLWKNRQLL